MSDGTKYTLQKARKILGLKRSDLAQQSGIAYNTIKSIESENRQYQIHEGVAQALAAALGLDVTEIQWPNSLSHRGRPPKTGVPIRIKVTTEIEAVACPECFCIPSSSGSCCCPT